MAYTIKLGSFAKHDNSTARPDTSGWAAYNIVLKEGSSIENPRITLSEDLYSLIDFNYAYFLDRYYFIVNKTMLRSDFCILDLSLDVLATYKNEIGSSPLYILRSSASSDGDIVDSMYPVTGSRSISNVELDDYPSASFSGGVYVITVAGTNTAGSTLYQLSPENFRRLVSSLLATISDYVDVDVISAIHNSIFRPMDYINGVMWFPEAFPTSGTETVYIGKWNSGITAGVISNTIKNLYYKLITLPKHPQAASRGNFLNLAPYSDYILQFEPFGLISLDTSKIIGATSIDISVYIEALTGMAALIVGNPANSGVAPIASVTAQIGTPVQITNHAANISAIGNTIANVGAIVSGNYMGIGSNAIDSAASAIAGVTSTFGSNGGILGQYLPKRLTATFLDIADEDNARNGRPLCQIATPSSLGGYMTAQEGDIVAAAPLPILNQIKGYLEGGFYYE